MGDIDIIGWFSECEREKLTSRNNSYLRSFCTQGNAILAVVCTNNKECEMLKKKFRKYSLFKVKLKI